MTDSAGRPRPPLRAVCAVAPLSAAVSLPMGIGLAPLLLPWVRDSGMVAVFQADPVWIAIAYATSIVAALWLAVWWAWVRQGLQEWTFLTILIGWPLSVAVFGLTARHVL